MSLIPDPAILLEAAPDAVVATDQTGAIIYLNAQAERLFGYERSELLGQPLEILIPEQFRSAHHRHFAAYREKPSARSMGVGRELFARRKDGSEFPAEISLSQIPGEGSGVALSAIRDVSERNRAQLERALLASVVNSSEDAIFATTPEGVITHWNSGAERIYGYSAAEIIGQPVSTLIPEGSNEMEEILGRLRQGERVDHYETQRVRKRGQVISVSLTVSPIHDAAGVLRGTSAIARDITDQKRVRDAMAIRNFELESLAHTLSRAEGRTRTALREKEARLKDVHQRVHTNLQVACSLLSMQLERALLPALPPALLSALNRVKAMALAHEQLAQSNTADAVEMSAYIQALTNRLVQVQGAGAARVSLDVRCDPVFLPVEEAALVGLILNELISNSLQHAFPDDAAGRVQVRLRRRDGSMELRVADDGRGLPPGFSIDGSSSMGLQVVAILARELEAEIRTSSREGASFTVAWRSAMQSAA